MTITSDNYEEWFYRYAEGELDAEQRAAVEAFAAQHPDLAEELALYSPSLKMEAEPMVYADKESLMRTQPRAIVLWRWAAAACTAGILLAGVWQFGFGGYEESPMVAKVTLPQPSMTRTYTATPAPTAQAEAVAATIKRSTVAKPTTRVPSPTLSEPAREDGTAPAPQPTAEEVEPQADMTQTEPTTAAEPVVVIHHEIYVTASAEPVIVQEESFPDTPESGIEGLRALGRGFTARLRAEALQVESKARVALASL